MKTRVVLVAWALWMHAGPFDISLSPMRYENRARCQQQRERSLAELHTGGLASEFHGRAILVSDAVISYTCLYDDLSDRRTTR